MSVLLDDKSVGTTGPLLVKLGGSILEHAAAAQATFARLAALHAERVGGLVVVHGGGAEVDRHLARLAIQSDRRDGIRITPAGDIDEVVAVLAGKVNTAIVGRLQINGVAAVGLSLADGYLAHTVKAAGYAFDPGQVGEIDGGDPRLVKTLLDAGFLPVISSIGLDANGHALNVNADHAAAGLAAVLGAAEIILLTDVPGVLDADGLVEPTLTADDVEARIANGAITGGMIPKVRSAVAVAGTSTIPVTIASWQRADGPAGWGGTTFLPDGPRGRAPLPPDHPLLHRWLRQI